MIKAVSLFSGAGGMDIGFEKAGIDVVFANEIDNKKPIKGIKPWQCRAVFDQTIFHIGRDFPILYFTDQSKMDDLHRLFVQKAGQHEGLS